MHRLARYDVADLARPAPQSVSLISFGLFCSVVAIALRGITDIWLPGAGPFALTVPIVLIATLFGRWQAGIVCQTIAGLHAWYYILPTINSFGFDDPTDGPRVIVNLVAGYLAVLLAEIFRRANRMAMEEREVLLYELEHRVKNSFASISAVLHMQQRSTDDEATRNSLAEAIGQIESYARAYSFLSHSVDRHGEIDIAQYLKEFCETLQASSASSGVRFECRSDPVIVSRDRAITIGLLVNEIATNAVKHAFDENGGTVSVSFEDTGDGPVLSVSDDGKGMSRGSRDGGHGMTLINALAAQAGGTVAIETGAQGTIFRIAFDSSEI